MKAAVIFNSTAKKDNALCYEIGRAVTRLFDGYCLYAHEQYGSCFLPDGVHSDFPAVEGGYKESLYRAVEYLLGCAPDVFVTVGGDGLASYVAYVMKSCHHVVPMFSIAFGTANVGPIVSFSLKDLDGLDLGMLSLVDIDGIMVSVDGRDIAYAFNDLIFGDTLLATVDGVTRNISAEKLDLDSKVEVKIPGRRIAGLYFSIKRNGIEVEIPFPGSDIGQIIVSPLQFDRLYGRAVLGALCNAFSDKAVGAVCLAGDPIVDMEAGDWSSVPLFHSVGHMLFKQGEVLEFSGLGPDAHVIVDGNPFTRRDGQVVSCTLEEGAVKAFRRLST